MPMSPCWSAPCRARPAWSAATCCSANGGIFKPQGKALSESAKKDVKILVVGNPANTNALIAMSNAPGPRPEALHRDDPPRPQPCRQPARAATGTTVNDVTNMTIWGNHSVTQFPTSTTPR